MSSRCTLTWTVIRGESHVLSGLCIYVVRVLITHPVETQGKVAHTAPDAARRLQDSLFSKTMAKDRQWLKQRLCTTLGWDEVVVEGVVEAIASAESAEEVNALIQVSRPSYLTAAVLRFLDSWSCP